jgi:hypothetical protein
MRRPRQGRHSAGRPVLAASMAAGLAAFALLAAVAVALVPSPTSASAAAAGDTCPGHIDRNGNCVITRQVPVPGSTQPGHHGGPGGPGPTGPAGSGNGGDPNYFCEFHEYPDQAHWRTVFPDAPPDAVFGEYHCFLGGNAIFGPYAPTFVAPTQGLGPAPAPPTPAQVAAAGLVDVEALLKKPQITTSPPGNRPSILDLPTFVSVTNWQGTVRRSNCQLNVCVEITATPKLTFAPGETGAPSVHCEDGGTVFDPQGASVRAQAAAPGACAYAYQRRTGVRGRPDAWRARATVTWDVAWAGGGDNGTFDPFTLSTGFDRTVEELQGVVVDYSR